MQSSKTSFKKRAYLLALDALELIDSLPAKKAYWSLGDQLLRSITSIGANVVEAKSASSKRDFVNFYNIALKSANESKFWLSLIKDSDKGNSELASKMLEETEELANIIAASILTLKGKRKL